MLEMINFIFSISAFMVSSFKWGSDNNNNIDFKSNIQCHRDTVTIINSDYNLNNNNYNYFHSASILLCK